MARALISPWGVGLRFVDAANGDFVALAVVMVGSFFFWESPSYGDRWSLPLFVLDKGLVLVPCVSMNLLHLPPFALFARLVPGGFGPSLPLPRPPRPPRPC